MITNLADQLRRDEAEKRFAYDDADGSILIRGRQLKGNLTIGIGRNLSAKGLSAAERAFLLDNDIAEATQDLETHFPWTESLSDVRKGVLLNMVFNQGIDGLSTFKDMLGKIQAGDYSGASQAGINSLWAKQVGSRAQRLMVQLESDFWQ